MFRRTTCLVGLFLLICHIARGAEEKTTSEATEFSTNDVDGHPAWSLLPGECGRTRFDSLSKRIIMGEEAKLGQFPWMAQLGYGSQYIPEIKPFFICGGAILSRYYILTAAHCGNEISIARVGENHRLTNIDCEDGVCAPHPQDIAIGRTFFSNYDKKTNKGDIALIELQSAMTFNDFVQPICLPRGELIQKNFVGRTVHIAGWGVTDVRAMKQAGNLMYISVPIVDSKGCDAIFRHDLDSSQFCAGFDKGKDSCAGDSGGPVTRSERFGGERRNFVLGIVSYGKTQCGTGVAVYTKVAFYVRWILSQIVVS